jgi:hypothetical protein
MKVKRVVMLSDTDAVVHLQPSWLARLFGAQDLVCELVKLPDEDAWKNAPTWFSKHTNEKLAFMHWGSLIRRAMEFQPLESDPPVDESGAVSLPNARALRASSQGRRLLSSAALEEVCMHCGRPGCTRHYGADA